MKITVLGDLIADIWLTGSADHLSREAPIPAIAVHAREVRPGGAGNAAANLAAMGADVSISAVVGCDEYADAVSDALREAGVSLALSSSLTRTHSKTRAVVDGQILARIDEIDPHADSLPQHLPQSGAVLIADYGLGFHKVIDHLIPLRDSWSMLVVDSHTPEAWSALRPDLVTPNWNEARALLPPLVGARREHVDAHREQLLAATNAQLAMVTLDRDGCCLFSSTAIAHGWTTPVPERFTIGAGDSATAAAMIALLNGASLEQAVARAAAAARCAIRREGTTIVHGTEVEAALHDVINLRDAAWVSTS